MIQDKYQIDLFLKTHPNASNDEVYTKFQAITDNEKNYIRNRKSRLSKKKFDTRDTGPGPTRPTIINKLTEDVLEALICESLTEDVNESKLRIAVDFFTKIKASNNELTSQELDLEGFLKYELSHREKESS